MESTKNLKSTNDRMVQNFQAQTDMLFDSAGVNFGPAETHRINLALRALAQK